MANTRRANSFPTAPADFSRSMRDEDRPGEGPNARRTQSVAAGPAPDDRNPNEDFARRDFANPNDMGYSSGYDGGLDPHLVLDHLQNSISQPVDTFSGTLAQFQQRTQELQQRLLDQDGRPPVDAEYGTQRLPGVPQSLPF